MRKLTQNTLAAASFAALLLTGACASHQQATVETSDDVVQVTSSNTVAPTPGPALVDSNGNIYSSSAAPGSGNYASVGTNTNVNIIPDRSTITVAENGTITSNTATLDTTPTMADSSGTTVTTVTTTAPVTTTNTSMTSSSTIDDTQSTTDDTTATTTTETRTRMRKD